MNERPGASYVVECFWPDVHEQQVEQAAARARRGAEQLTSEGKPVAFTGSILIREDEVVLYLFDAVSAQAVREACDRAAIRFERVVDSVQRPAAIGDAG